MSVAIAVLGVGVACGAGIGPDALKTFAAGPVDPGPRRLDDFEPARHVPFRGTRALCRTSQLACVAAAQAVAEAGTSWSATEPERRAVVVGTQYGSIGPLATFNRAVVGGGPQSTTPMSFPNVVVNVHAGHLGIFFGAAGPNLTVCGPVAGLEAVAEGLELIELDRADVVVCGGAESGDAPVGLADPGEGAAMIVVARRGTGAGSGAWAEIAEPLWGPPCSVGRDALDAAGLRADEVDWWDASWPPVDAGSAPARYRLRPATGDCRAADGVLALVAALDAVRRRARPALVLAHRPTGAAAGTDQGVAVVVRPTRIG